MTFNSLIPRFLHGLTLLGGFLWLSVVRAEGEAKTDYPSGYVEEAPLPENFPPPGEPGKVIEKTYPAVRSYSSTGRGAFMKCFGYLTLKQHKMTAPVVMECKPDGEPLKELVEVKASMPIERMHFLLEKNSLDEPKSVGAITVADMPEMRVLSIAVQGKLTSDAVKQGRAALEARLKEMTGTKQAGEYRILGYNSPMLNPSKNFWELQLPIAEEPKADEGKADQRKEK